MGILPIENGDINIPYWKMVDMSYVSKGSPNKLSGFPPLRHTENWLFGRSQLWRDDKDGRLGQTPGFGRIKNNGWKRQKKW